MGEVVGGASDGPWAGLWAELLTSCGRGRFPQRRAVRVALALRWKVLERPRQPAQRRRPGQLYWPFQRQRYSFLL